MLESARWGSHYLACDDVVIDGITVLSSERANRDGIGIDSCNRVRIANCRVETGDDAIVLKATAHRPCKNVTVTTGPGPQGQRTLSFLYGKDFHQEVVVPTSDLAFPFDAVL